MATLAYRWYKNRKNRQLVETSEPDTSNPSYPTDLSKPYQPKKSTKEKLTKSGPTKEKLTKSGKKHDCIHRRAASQISESEMELTAYPGGPAEIHEKTDMDDTPSPCAECQEAKRAAIHQRKVDQVWQEA
ncbi:hypothetical protein V498_00058 [Pseudogymnoascus sp. VKM F-4517 (FW-2822)]|nr:hypothetical protein V498_00058 [Pseudogymnoascus sp. VKM F-4517 (FW-2822)]